MQSSKRFCLRWNDFKDNIKAAVTALRKDIYLSNVNLACEDVAIVDLLYYGEANTSNDNLTSFLNIAEVLELIRLDGGDGREFEKLPDRTAVLNHFPQKKSVPDQTYATPKNVGPITHLLLHRS